MAEIKTGGPAFPHDNQELGGMHRMAQPGMSLRDWYAGQIIGGLFANSNLLGLIAQTRNDDENNGQVAGRISYEFADAMLKAREVRS